MVFFSFQHEWLASRGVAGATGLDSRNSVLVNVKEKMWVESVMLYLMDWIENIDSEEFEVRGLDGGVNDVD